MVKVDCFVILMTREFVHRESKLLSTYALPRHVFERPILLHILKVEARRPWHRLLCTLRQRFYTLTVTHADPIRLNNHDLHSPAPRRPL